MSVDITEFIEQYFELGISVDTFTTIDVLEELHNKVHGELLNLRQAETLNKNKFKSTEESKRLHLSLIYLKNKISQLRK